MDNRARILACALDLFAARGYGAVGVQEVAETAGVTKPTLYHYFGSKQGLLQALLREYSLPFAGRLRRAAAYSGDLPLTLTRVVATCFGFAREQPVFYRLQLAMWFTPPESEAFRVGAPFLEEFSSIVEDMFARAVADHGNMRGRQRQYAATFLGMINTIVAMALNGYVELDDELVARAVHQFSHGIYS
ncbi:MAG: TetR/AcrR family transcriptional regulator [Chloroflexota bacterium]